ncbi:MAG TPA: hypothetical protein VEA17_20260, partial [Bordetella sp.]|nr:hypothetical protein [Bordetella sp.]
MRITFKSWNRDIMHHKRIATRNRADGQASSKRKERVNGRIRPAGPTLHPVDQRPALAAAPQALPFRAGLAVGLLGAAAWTILPSHALAQSCGMQGSIYTCNYSGTSTAYNLYTGSPDASPMVVTTSGNVVMSVRPGQGTGLNFGAFGENSSGGNVYGLQFNNTGSITLNYGSGWDLNPYGIQASLGGGSGNPGGL